MIQNEAGLDTQTGQKDRETTLTVDGWKLTCEIEYPHEFSSM